MSDSQYTRLTRAHRRLVGGGLFSVSAGYSSLWLGPDHMLCIDVSGVAEEYKRFYYSDIQAIIVKKNWRGLVRNILACLPLLFFLAVAVFADDTFANIFCGFIALMIGLMLGFNLYLGTTVTTYLRTAVQIEELPSLNTIRRARKAMAKLRPLIAAAQGELVPGEIAEKLPELYQAAPLHLPSVPPAAPPPLNP